MLQRSIRIVASCLWLTVAGCGDGLTAKTIREVTQPPAAATPSPTVAEPAGEPAKAPSKPEPGQTPNIDQSRPVVVPDRPAPGGQSGGEGLGTCDVELLPLSEAADRGTPIRDVFAGLEQQMSAVPGLKWRPIGPQSAPPPPTTLAVTRVKFGEKVALGCTSLETTIEFDAHSADDQLDGHFAGKLTGTIGIDRNLTVEAAMAEGDLMAPARGDIPSDTQLALTFHWRDGDPNVIQGALSAGGEQLASVGDAADFPVWGSIIDSTPEPAFDIVPTDVQRAACANVAPTSKATFDTEQALEQSLSKRWIACEGRTNVDFDGLEIDSTGHWRELKLENGEFVPVRGFGREGEAVRNVFGSDFNLALLDMAPERYAFYDAGLSADGNTLRLDGQQTLVMINATFQATDLPVREPPAMFEKGARAGEAACAVRPMNLTTRPASIDVLRGLLAGSWTFCRGGLGTQLAGIRFDAGDRFAMLAADGSIAEEGTLTIIDTSTQNGPGAWHINLRVGGREVIIGMPIFANTPLMMMANDDTGSVLSAM